MTTSEAIKAIGKHIYGLLEELTHTDLPVGVGKARQIVEPNTQLTESLTYCKQEIIRKLEEFEKLPCLSSVRNKILEFFLFLDVAFPLVLPSFVQNSYYWLLLLVGMGLLLSLQIKFATRIPSKHRRRTELFSLLRGHAYRLEREFNKRSQTEVIILSNLRPVVISDNRIKFSASSDENYQTEIFIAKSDLPDHIPLNQLKIELIRNFLTEEDSQYFAEAFDLSDYQERLEKIIIRESFIWSQGQEQLERLLNYSEPEVTYSRLIY